MNYRLIGAVLIFAIGVIAIMIFARQTDNVVDETTQTSLATENTVATLSFERTAIARFTESPEDIESLTPFYGMILWNEAHRQITQTPTLSAIEPTPECWLVADFWQLKDFASNIEQAFDENEVETSVQAFTSVVWNYDTCLDYIPVSNRISVWIIDPIDLELADEENILYTLLETLDELIPETEDISTDKSNILIFVYFNDGDIAVNTNWLTAQRAYNENLQGQELFDALQGSE